MSATPQPERVMTVTGPIAPDAMGATLVHEHVMSTFGADLARYPVYDVERLLDAVLPYLVKLQGLGCRTLVDCTAAYFGRHPELLRRIAQESGLHILTNTGYYGAAGARYVPPHAYAETAGQVARRWTFEWEWGIDGTEIRPGFIKTGVDPGPLSEIDRKLITAAARAHRQTGLTIQTHTGDNRQAAHEILDILDAEGAHSSAWIWVHAHGVPDIADLAQAAARGAWISLDGLNAERAAHTLALLQALREQGYMQQVLLSHDGGFRPYHYLFTDFVPLLRENGFSAAEIAQLTVDNPRRAFTVQPRLLG